MSEVVVVVDSVKDGNKIRHDLPPSFARAISTGWWWTIHLYSILPDTPTEKAAGIIATFKEEVLFLSRRKDVLGLLMRLSRRPPIYVWDNRVRQIREAR